MASRKHKKNHDDRPAPRPARRRSILPPLLMLMIVCAALAFVVWSATRRETETARDSSQAAANATTAADTTSSQDGSPPSGDATDSQPERASAPASRTNGFSALVGKWVRPDGGYVLEIRGVDEAGKMAAGYFNPQPIYVAKAEASREGDTTKIFIELQAPNYPGSTYTLVHDPQNDQLQGTYFQAATQQSFEVLFVRMD